MSVSSSRWRSTAFVAAFSALFLVSSAPLPADDAATSAPLRLHYHRHDGNYNGVTVWTWDATGAREPDAPELEPSGRDDYGVVFEVDLGRYGADDTNDRIGFLIRFDRNWDRKDGLDRFWTTSMGRDIYLIGGEARMETEQPDVSPAVAAAFYDAGDRVTIRLSHPVVVGGVETADVTIRDAEGRTYSVVGVAPIRDALYSVTLGETLPFEKRYLSIEVEGYRPATIEPRGVLSDPHLFYDATATLGAECTPTETTFGVFSPVTMKAWVVLYDEPTGAAGRREIPMTRGRAGIWSATVTDDLHGAYYMYRLEGYRLDPTNEALDPYARCTSSRGGRGLIVDLRRTDPDGFRPIQRPPMPAPNDFIAYEIHVRDFTIAPNSGVSQKGKYLGFVEEGTTLPDHPDVSTGLDHLVELGITHVQLLPVQDFDNDEFNQNEYNWGYMPSHFNSPDGWYASEVYGQSRVTEFKQMVAALHARGIRVVMDVVYNHTDNSAPFDNVCPGYYYRTKEDGSFWNGSGTGNEFKSENPMARRFIVDSCAYWVREYGVSGFRFDLMGLIDLDTMLAIQRAVREIDPTVVLYGEPWAAAGSGLPNLTTKSEIRGTGIGAFNDHFRDAVKGSTRGAGTGFVQRGENRPGVMNGLAGSLGDWAIAPTEPINYVDCHDDMILFDKIVASAPAATEVERAAMNRLALALVLTAQGRAFIHGGTEFLRTKQGVDNSYSAPDAINQIDWSLKLQNRELCKYVAGLIALRRAHPVFRLTRRAEVLHRVKFIETGSPDVIAMDLDGRGVAGETWSLVRVIHSAAAKQRPVPLPPGEWNVVVLGDDIATNGGPLEVASGTVLVPPRSTFIAWQ